MLGQGSGLRLRAALSLPQSQGALAREEAKHAILI